MSGLKVYNKKLNRVEKEPIYYEFLIRLLYGTGIFARLFSLIFLPLVAYIPFFSKRFGRRQSLPSSKNQIRPFIKKFNIDEREFLDPVDTFSSFNAFFVRRLKQEARPIDPDPKALIAPCDGRVHVIRSLDQSTSFMMKGVPFNLQSLVQDDELEAHFHGGSAFLARLAPCDYHRFHFPCEGRCSPPRLIQGPLFSVNPIAICRRPSILWENKRMVSLLETEEFGRVLMVEIGATYVGSIHHTFDFNSPFQKGEEKGYFSFGGSSIVLIFEKGRIEFEPILYEYSAQGIEVLMRWGERIAHQL